MSSHYAAWRFTFGGMPTSGRSIGLGVSARGSIDLVTDGDATRQAILMLLATRPGERVMRPGYGCHLFRLAFAPNDDTTAGLAIHYVRRALERWEPRVDILRLDANAHPDHPDRLEIHLQYRPASGLRAEALQLSLSLGSGQVL